jgi:hypothetical protein
MSDMLLRHSISWSLFALTAVALVSPAAADDALRINQIQVIGTHNSYHMGFAPSATRLMQSEAPQALAAIDYSHPALTRQLDDGVRQIELDVFADPKGGKYAHPSISHMIDLAGLPDDPPMAPPGVFDQPGFKVMHIQDIDQRSTCQPFTTCLTEVRTWSKAHPGHVPIFILIETKDGALQAKIPSVTPDPFTPAVFDALDKEIASVFAADEIITPDQVRGGHATLDEAVREGGWPTLTKARGKVVFLLDQRKAESIYLEGHPVLKDRMIFTNATPGAPDAAFTECNECTAAQINELVHRGYLVRTRSDDPEQGQGKRNDGTRRDAIINSGAQMISTDYPAGEPSEHGYQVGLPDGVAARCNPVLVPDACKGKTLEKLAKH